jgi:hypothetical protein
MSRAQRGESNLPADMGIASPPAAARNVTVENFLPQRWIVGGQLVGNLTMLYFGIVVIARAFSARNNPLVIGRLFTLDSQGDCFGGYRRLAMTGDR